MSGESLGALIDLMAAHLKPHLGGNDEAADAVATELAGAITSRHMVLPLPSAAEELTARAEIDSMFPGLFTRTTKGPTQ